MRALIDIGRRRRRDAARDERGFMLVIAMLVLTVLLALAAVVAASASSVNNSVGRVAASDRALAAADAGVQAALYRLNNTGQTTAETDSLGHGASYAYTLSRLNAQSDACAGLWVQNQTSPQPLEQMCITSTGTAGGVTARVQDRVVGYAPATQVFPVNGIFAVNGFTANNNFTDDGAIRSNGQISWGGGQANINGTVEYVGGYPPVGTCVAPCFEQLVDTLPVPTSSATTDAAYANAAAANSDSTVAWSSKMTYSATTQTVVDNTGGNNTITLEPGTYYFCNLSLNNQTTIQADSTTVSVSRPVVIYIDSPYRSGSACAAGTGNITDKNTLNVIGIAGAASAFQIYFYGEPDCPVNPAVPCPDNFSQNNQTYSNVQIYAPYSTLATSNNITMQGDFVIGTVAVNNGATFDYTGSGSGQGNGSTLTSYYPSAHQICRLAAGTSC